MNFTIECRPIGTPNPAYIVAELSANHRHSLDRAIELVHAAKEAGADAVKLQTYTPETMTIESDRPEFRVRGGTLWDGQTLFDLYREAHTPWEWHAPLMTEARSLGMACFSTPFDATAVDFLESLAVPAYKIASFEIVDLELLDRVAATRKPVLLSTGMATRQEIAEALGALRREHDPPIALLKCTSAYPAPEEDANLRTIADMAASFHVVAGLSDHTLGLAVPVAAVSLGASIIEKHLTLSREAGGPDAAFSLEPAEFREMVDAVRTAESALGRVVYGPTASDAKSLAFRRSLFVVKDMRAGERFSRDNVRAIRPGHGLPPRHLKGVLGMEAAIELSRGTPLDWSHLRPPR